jgi:hypothetical protein
MKQLVPKPNSCTFRIERAGIRLPEEIVLTQYTITSLAVTPPVGRKHNHRE